MGEIASTAFALLVGVPLIGAVMWAVAVAVRGVVRGVIHQPGTWVPLIAIFGFWIGGSVYVGTRPPSAYDKYVQRTGHEPPSCEGDSGSGGRLDDDQGSYSCGHGADLDCADLDRATAQLVLDMDDTDPNRLDADNDGKACEPFVP